MDVYYRDCASSTNKEKICRQVSKEPYVPNIGDGRNQCIDDAKYSQWHRQMEAMQHAVQSQAYRRLSGF